MDYKSIIEAAYNRKNWQELLHDIFASRIQFWATPSKVPTTNDTAQSAYYLAKITLADGKMIAVYEVKLVDSVIIERNKVSIRNLLVQHWKNNGFAGAFMFCYKNNESVLRFSYVSEVLAFNEDGKLATEATDTKRFTYYLGEGHRSRTAIDQFTKLKGSGQTLDDITKAFSIEAVSDAFFAGYKNIYEDIVEYMTGKRMTKVGNKWEEVTVNNGNPAIVKEFSVFENPLKSMRDYAKKLLGRLVFLQFIQKKGWLGVKKNAEWGTGDKEFMSNLFANSKQKDNFIDKVLEPLFNDINTQRDGDLVSDKNVGTDIKVPFLNGGLFERDKEDETTIKLPAKYFERLFDFFSQYNFTIDENDPNDTEVGVDPEMLGRIFENLLEDNKDKGAFYTPKEIVRYMCAESLIAYLQTDIAEETDKDAIRNFVATHEVRFLTESLIPIVKQKLKDVKICDPAIGSGAFPIGLLNELFACCEALEGEQANRAEIKKHIIQNSIYGVDIEKGAVDIARLRFWLSLVVDEDKPDALPNLDFKIMQGNSLLEQYKSVDLSKLMTGKKVNMQMDIFDNNLNQYRSNLNSLINDYFSTKDHSAKIKLKKQIQQNVNEQMKASNINADFNSLGIDVAGNDQFFLWHTWLADVFNRPNDCNGFDIVIGNPPYVKEYTNRSAFDGFRETSPYYMGKMDLWYGFACHGIDLLKQNGILCFIAQNNWTTSAGAKKMRNKVLNDSQILQMLDFNTYMVFENAEIQTMIMVFKRNQDIDNYNFDYRLITQGNEKDDMLALLAKIQRNTKYLSPSINRESFIGQLLTFSDNDQIFEKIAKDKIHLTDDEVAQGIVFPQDFLDKKGAAKLCNKYPIGTGIFGLNQTKLDSMILNDKELELIQPYFTTEQIHRYYTEPNNKQWLIYTDSSFKRPEKMKEYPNLKEHLDNFVEILTSDNKPYGLHRCRKQTFFQGEKIISLRKCAEKPCFSYSDFDCYVTQTFFSIKSSRWNLKCLTGILNSKLVAFWLRHKGKMQGSNYQVDKEPLLGIPLLILEKKQQQPIISLVDQILAAKKSDPQADTTSIENEIDKIVYQLYDLSYEEVLMVDPNTTITKEEYAQKS